MIITTQAQLESNLKERGTQIDLLLTEMPDDSAQLALLPERILTYKPYVKLTGAVVVYGTKQQHEDLLNNLPPQLTPFYRYRLAPTITNFLSKNRINTGAVFRFVEPPTKTTYNTQCIKWFGEPPFTLEEYIIHTYTNPNDIVFDFNATIHTLIAAESNDRNFIGLQENPALLEDLCLI